jgi:carbon storage regulator
MLVLTRRPGQAIYVGDDIVITIVEVKGNQVRVGIAAPPERKIFREEIYQQILAENVEAASQATGIPRDLSSIGSRFAVRKASPIKRTPDEGEG